MNYSNKLQDIVLLCLKSRLRSKSIKTVQTIFKSLIHINSDNTDDLIKIQFLNLNNKKIANAV